MRATAFLGVSITLAMAVAGCGGLSGELTTAICDCEHCDDWAEDESSAQFDAQQKVADAYGCSDRWDEYMQCQIDKGTCDEKAADWSVRAAGSCSATMDLGTPCMTSADCTGGPGTQTCSAMMTCTTPSCAGGGGPCQTDSDCPGGENKCQNEQDKLYQCEAAASDHNGPIGP